MPFDPLSNFTGGKKGAWWSFRNGVNGTPFSQVNDLSPNANHLFQSSATNRPVYNVVDGVGRAVFDTTDFMTLLANAPLDIGSNTSVTVIAAIRHTGGTGGPNIICESGAPTNTFGGFSAILNNTSNGTFGGGLGSNSAASYNFRNVSGISVNPRSYVATITFDTTQAPGSEMIIRIDGIVQTTYSLVAVGDTVGNVPSGHSFAVGCRSEAPSYFLNAELFDLMILPGQIDPAVLLSTEEYIFNACNF